MRSRSSTRRRMKGEENAEGESHEEHERGRRGRGGQGGANSSGGCLETAGRTSAGVVIHGEECDPWPAQAGQAQWADINLSLRFSLGPDGG
eukprot:1157103-Pyramimonas_sp.AAC.1